MIKFELGGTAYEYDDTQMSVKEARLIKQHTGMGLRSWALGLQDMDVDALVAVVFLAKRRAGEAIRWQDLDTINVNDITIVNDEDVTGGVVEDDDEEKGADAGPPASKSRRSSTAGKTRS